MLKESTNRYESMTKGELKQELYKLYYEIATSPKKGDVKRYTKEIGKVKKALTKIKIEEELNKIVPEDDDRKRRGGSINDKDF